MWQRTIDCLGVAVRVTTQLEAPTPALDALFRTYANATSPGPGIAYELARGVWPRLVRDGALVMEADEEIELVPVLERDLYTQVMARARGLLVHAGAVIGTRGGALVFAGQSGAGKSTLVRALLARGFRYVTEECIAFVGEASCRGLTRSLHVDDPSTPLLPGFTVDPYEISDRHGVRRTRLFHPPAASVWRGVAPVAALVLIDHGEDANNLLVPVSGGETLIALWPLVFRQDATAITDASSGLVGVPAYRLRTTTPENALARVLALAEEHGVGI